MVTLTGTFTRLDGTPATGTVKVTPSRSPIMDPDGKIVISGPQTFPLDKDGKLTTEIPASNDPDLGPPFTYAIDVNLTHANWKISKVWIPHGSTTVDLSDIADYEPTPGMETRVVTIPADGADGQVLVWDGAGFSWDYPPTGPQGPKGDMDAEQLAGAPRLTNLAYDITWLSTDATIDSQADRLIKFTATAQNGFIRRGPTIANGKSYYYAAEVKATSDQVFFGTSVAPVHHSGSGDWERLTGTVTLSGSSTWFLVRDTRSSGWDSIEVRDPVLIDLTAVFGAGREPTKEYMDALLAKHGHYIGAVEPFVFSDLLRYDTSVGTRVFLDHPGGSVMLSGDTGWRTLTSWTSAGAVTGNPLPNNMEPHPDRDGFIAIRRVDGTVHVVIRAARIQAPATLPLPVGFRPGNSRENRYSATVNTNASVTLYAQVGNVALYISASAYPANGDGIYGSALTFPTTAPWPTALPGLPS